MQHQRRRAQIACMHQIQVHSFADDPLVPRLRRTHQVRREVQPGVFGEVGDQVLLGWILPVAGDSRERDLQVVALWADRLHLHRLPWFARSDDHRTCREVEGYAQHVGVLDVELVVLVQFVGLTPERPAHHLLAQELRSEGPARPGRESLCWRPTPRSAWTPTPRSGCLVLTAPPCRQCSSPRAEVPAPISCRPPPGCPFVPVVPGGTAQSGRQRRGGSHR